MPCKKNKFNSRFPPARIKKIMQTDKEVGKVAAAVPVLISKALEHFIETLLLKASQQTQEKKAKTLTPSHIKQCINREKVFDFLKDLVEDVPDLENPTEEHYSTGPERRAHTNNRRRTWRKPRASKSTENSSSEEDFSTDSGGEAPNSTCVTATGSTATGTGTMDGGTGHPDTTQVSYGEDPGERMTTLVECHDEPGPSLASPAPPDPSISMPCPVTQPTTNSAPLPPMGEYKPRRNTEELREEEDYDT